MMKVLKCEKCGSPMVKQGTMRSSNVKYERYVCEKCKNVFLKCLGVEEK